MNWTLAISEVTGPAFEKRRRPVFFTDMRETFVHCRGRGDRVRRLGRGGGSTFLRRKGPAWCLWRRGRLVAEETEGGGVEEVGGGRRKMGAAFLCRPEESRTGVCAEGGGLLVEVAAGDFQGGRRSETAEDFLELHSLGFFFFF